MIKFMGSFDKVSQLPKTNIVEYAFIGRSNVGKSSLINAFAGHVIARTSKTPGRTQSLNLFNFNDSFMIMDLPGYGYAKVSKTDSLRWLERLEEYLLNRSQLSRLFILIDSRVGVKNSDIELMEFCDAHGVPFQIIYTKKDKRIREEKQMEIKHTDHPAMIEEIVTTSAEKKTGIDILRGIIGYKL